MLKVLDTTFKVSLIKERFEITFTSEMNNENVQLHIKNQQSSFPYISTIITCETHCITFLDRVKCYNKVITKYPSVVCYYYYKKGFQVSRDAIDGNDVTKTFKITLSFIINHKEL